MDSTLNPKAPEFFPELKKVTQNGYLLIKKAVKSSKVFTTDKYHSLKTLPAFKSVTSDLCRYVDSQIQDILVAETPKFLFIKEQGDEFKEEQIVTTNSNILDRVSNNLEELCKMDHIHRTDKNNQNIPPQEDEPMNEDLADIDQEDMLYMEEVMGAASNSHVYNIENIWVPILPEKPNYLVPFELKLLYDADGKAIEYEHPYRIELSVFEPASYLINATAEPIPFPAPLKNTNYKFINTLSKLDDLLRHLREVDELAVDVEHHSFRAYRGITCLVQITTFRGDFIIDAMLLRRHLYKLNFAFTDPKKIKVFHGADMDVLWLQRDLGVYIVGLFDTYQAAVTLDLEKKSLKALLKLYCNVNTDKKYQTADWRVRPLPYEMVKYARTDTHYLLYIWKRMKNQLLEKSNGQRETLLKVFTMSRDVCLSTYKKHVVTETSHLSLYQRYHKDFDLSWRSLAALKILYKWRDDYARELDESPAYVLPNVLMLTLAEKLPTDLKSIREYCPSARKVLKRSFIKILEMIKTCRDMPEPPPAVMPLAIRPTGELSHHMLDLPNTSDSDLNGDVAMASENLHEPDYAAGVDSTSYETGSGDNRFCSPYLRYVKCVKVEAEQQKEDDKKEVPVAEITNTENDLTEFTPIFKNKETREKEAEERAMQNPEATEEAYGAGEGTSYDFTLVTRRKRKSRPRREMLDAQEQADKPAPPTKRVYYQYTNPNYKEFYTPRDKAIAKLQSKKRK
ncbi:PREDICTED: exosome complex exonuclease RRP6 [Papilio xuthus]|uniref:Exosome complex exonuclease RRP6 n=1 Tax=Papilio xuthus TaxID=66420 RepID=A0AAJ6ZU92_PAPXU|nr:PREDICTED: exosome complex exonuclease RRP6 [Papilio xuthus]